jgi:thiamine biosynthesis lipoprotein
MLWPTHLFDRTRNIGFRLCCALILLPGIVEAEWITRDEAIMGTRCAVELWSDDHAKGDAAITSVFDDMRRIDRLMSTWKEDTEISLVNREASKHPVKISEELFRLLQESVKYSELTHGAFDITYASVGYLYDFKKGVHPDQKAIAAALPGINWRHMLLDGKKFTVYFTRPGMRIDLGGIAKGYSVDRGSKSCKSRASPAPWSARAATRASSGSIRQALGGPFAIGSRRQNLPADAPHRYGVLDVRRLRAVSTERQTLPPSSIRRPGPARKCRSVTIISGRPRTDALTWSVFIMGPEDGIAFINTLPDVDAVAVAPDGKVFIQRAPAPPG